MKNNFKLSHTFYSLRLHQSTIFRYLFFETIFFRPRLLKVCFALLIGPVRVLIFKFMYPLLTNVRVVYYFFLQGLTTIVRTLNLKFSVCVAYLCAF